MYKFIADGLDGGHVHVRCFVGPDKDHLALSGTLVFREGEESELLSLLGGLDGKNHGITVIRTWEVDAQT